MSLPRSPLTKLDAEPRKPGLVWRLETFGGLRARRLTAPEAGAIEKFRTQKGAALTAYLAVGQRQFPRDHLIYRFWPDTDIDAGRNSLSVALHSLRKIFEPEGVPRDSVIDANKLTVGFRPGAIETDVHEFRSLVNNLSSGGQPEARQANLERAVALYQGPYLAGIDDQLTSEAPLLEDYYFRSLNELIGLIRYQDPTRAFEWARRGAEIDPLREDAQELILQLCPPGDEGPALRRFQDWCLRIRKTGDEPSLRVLAKADELRARGRRQGTDPKSAELPTASKTSGRDRTSGPAANPAGDAGETARANPPLAPGAPASEQAGAFASTQVGRTPVPGSPVPTRRLVPMPAPLTSFFGRAEDVARLHESLLDPESRLVTITGPGGAGKTRLAFEVLGRIRRATTSGLHVAGYVPLADLPANHPISGTIASGLGAPPGHERPDLLSAWIEEQYPGPVRPLLFLDNFEHLIESGTRWLQELLETQPRLVCLVTSRFKLLISGERELPLAPLSTPSEGVLDPAEAATFPSVKLFLNRARLARPNLPMTRANIDAAVRIASQLDGLPLAIELAAARVSISSPTEILATLLNNDIGQRAKSLDWTAADRNGPPRHRSLRAAIEWSVQQLPASYARFWRQLWVFRGGWTIDEAIQVCDEADAATIMLVLRDASLLRVDEGERDPGGKTRGSLLESLREYGYEGMEEADRQEISRRHAHCYLNMALAALPYFSTPNAEFWVRKLDCERDNLRAAMDWLMIHEPAPALKLAVALSWPWEISGRGSEAGGWLACLLEHGASAVPELERQARAGDADAKLALHWRAQALNGLGKLHNVEADVEAALTAVTEAHRLFELVDDEAGIADSLYLLGFMTLKSGDLDGAIQHCEKSVSINAKRNDSAALSDSLYNLAIIAMFQGDLSYSRELQNRRLEIHKNDGQRRGIATSLESLANVEVFERNFESANAHFTKALEHFEQLNEPQSVARCLWGLGHVERNRGQLVIARDHFERALRLTRTSGNTWAWPYLMEAFALLDADTGREERALTLLAAASSLRHARSEPYPSPVYAADIDLATNRLRSALGDAEFEFQWKLGTITRPESALDLALDVGSAQAVLLEDLINP